MKINIIHDSRMIERHDLFLKELRSQNITNYEIWPCIIMPSIVNSIAASHKLIVRKAQEQGLEEVLIAEDDFCFTHPNSFNFFLENKPKEYKLYSACNYLTRDRPAKELIGLHFYTLHESFYESFLNIKENLHIDTAISGIDIDVCYPYPVLQREGWSSNNRAICDYNLMLKEEDIYKG